ncbi:MAG: c-type cytochrome [Alphaproteobacteria bacterium]
MVAGRHLIGLFAVAVLAGTAAPAARAADAEAGRGLAESWCAGCHVIGEQGQPSASDAAPTFAAIANRPDTTADGLRAFLSVPHADAMKGIVLPRLEIDDLVAYIMSLRVN